MEENRDIRGGAGLGRFLAAWVGRARRYSALVAGISLVATVVLGTYTARNLGIDADTADMFSPEVDFRRRNEFFKERFPQFTGVLLVAVEAQSPDRARGAARELAAHCRESGLFASVYLPSDDPFFREHGLLFLSKDELIELAGTLGPLAPLIAWLRADPSLGSFADTMGKAVTFGGARLPAELVRVLDGLADSIDAALAGRAHAFGWSETFFPTGDLAVGPELLVLQPRLDYSSFTPGKEGIQLVRDAARELGYGPGTDVSVGLSGAVALSYEELQSAEAGAKMAGVVSLVLVFLLLILGFRSPRLVAAALLTLIAGLVWTAAFATALVGNINLISIAFAVLYISLGVDFSIHYGLRYAELRERGHDHGASLERAAADVGSSLVLAAVATSIGFLAFVPTDFQGVAEFGVIASGGMLISLFANLTLLPALFSLSVPRIRERRRDPPAVSVGADRRRYSGWVRGVSAALGTLSILAISFARFDADPLNLREPDSESVRIFRELAGSSTRTPYRIEVLVPTEAEVRALKERVAPLADVHAAVSLESFVPADQEAKLAVLAPLAESFGGEPPEPGEPPGAEKTREMLASLRSTLEQAGSGLPDDAAAMAAVVARLAAALAELDARLDSQGAAGSAQLLQEVEQSLLGGLAGTIDELATAVSTPGVTLEQIPEELRARWIADDGTRRVELLPEQDLTDADALKSFVSLVRAEAPEAIGAAVIITESGRLAVEAFREAFAWALTAIAIVLLLLLRSPLDAARVLAPLLLAGALTGAATVLASIDFNFANVIALPLLLGMGVGGGIHMVHRQRTKSPEDGALLGTSTARAVLFSSLTTLAGFGTLAISPHPGTASMGLLLLIGIGFSLVCTLVVLPALFADPDRGGYLR